MRLLLFVTGALLLVSALRGPATSADSAVSFTRVTPSVVPAVPDYALDVRGYAWDFSHAASYSPELTRPGFVDGSSLTGGWFVGTTAGNDAKVFLQDMSIPGTIPTPNEGASKPIDTSRYRYLDFRICLPELGAVIVYWHRDASYADGSFGATVFKEVATGCRTISFDLTTERLPSAGSLAWDAGPIETIAIKPAVKSGVQVRLDYVTLSSSSPMAAPAVTVSWTPVSAAFDLYFDSDPKGADATLIKAEVAGGAGQYTWVTPNLAPGSYYLIARTAGGQTASEPLAVSSPLKVNSPPDVKILAPSHTSGADFATTVNGDPWDMAGAADISEQLNVTGAGFANGVYSATNTNGDAGLALRVSRPIDPTLYYYLTYRMRLHGPQDIATGSVARVLWSAVAPNTEFATSKDIVVYEGWRTVTIDLRSIALEADSLDTWNTTSKVWIRFDPHEFGDPRLFEIDDVKLTGDDRASVSFTIRYTLSDVDNDDLRISFFYDTDRRGSDGKAISCAASGAGFCAWWLAGIPEGKYYVYLVVDDGKDTTVVYSDTPLQVRDPGEIPAAGLAVPPATKSRTILVSAFGSAAATQFYISESSVTPSPGDAGWKTQAPESFTLSQGDGKKTLYLWTRNAKGTISDPASAGTVLDTRAPARARLVIPPITNSATIAVEASAVDAVGVAGYFLSEQAEPPSASDSGWAAQAPTTFALSAGDGTKTVRLWARDAAGNISAVASDSILLDTVAPLAELQVPPTTTGRMVRVTVAGSDSNGVTGYFLNEDPTTPTVDQPGWRGSIPATFWLSAADGVKTLHLWTKDRAGNISSVAVVSTILDTGPPTMSFELPQVTRSRRIRVTITASDASGVTGYFLSEKGTKPAADAPGWLGAAPRSFLLSQGDGNKTVFAWVKDRIGNVTAGTSERVFLDTQPPRPTIALPRNGAVLAELRSIGGTLSDPAPSSGLQAIGSFAIARRSGASCSWWHRDQRKFVPGACAKPLWFNVAARGRWSTPVGLLKIAGSYTLFVRFPDRAGNSLPLTLQGETAVNFTIRPSN